MFGPSAKPQSGRYLSFAEREEIALLRAQGCTMQEVARWIGRAASTISRELRRNAATRSGGLEYRASAAQWHAERSARRPKSAKLVLNAALQAYVRTGWRGWLKLQAVSLFLARPYLGRGDDMDGGRIADGRVPGVLSRSLDACRLTSRMT